MVLRSPAAFTIISGGAVWESEVGEQAWLRHAIMGCATKQVAAAPQARYNLVWFDRPSLGERNPRSHFPTVTSSRFLFLERRQGFAGRSLAFMIPPAGSVQAGYDSFLDPSVDG